SIQRSEGEFYLSFLSEKIFYLILCNFPIPQLHLQVEFRFDSEKYRSKSAFKNMAIIVLHYLYAYNENLKIVTQ
ncbi:MAG: hypothetical protein SNH41_02285, partial [Rikenellaceae bacterium]